MVLPPFGRPTAYATAPPASPAMPSYSQDASQKRAASESRSYSTGRPFIILPQHLGFLHTNSYKYLTGATGRHTFERLGASGSKSRRARLLKASASPPPSAEIAPERGLALGSHRSQRPTPLARELRPGRAQSRTCGGRPDRRDHYEGKMRIERRYTKEGQSPYAGIAFR
jgi:hypothetical protein